MDSKLSRERRQAYKLEQSYINLRKSELEKEKELMERDKLRKYAQREKYRDIAMKFEKAE